MGVRRLKIGKLAEAANVNFETVRYYERIGLMPRPGRTSAGHRDSGTAPNKRVLHGKMHAVVSSEWHNETMR